MPALFNVINSKCKQFEKDSRLVASAANGAVMKPLFLTTTGSRRQLLLSDIWFPFLQEMHSYGLSELLRQCALESCSNRILPNTERHLKNRCTWEHPGDDPISQQRKHRAAIENRIPLNSCSGIRCDRSGACIQSRLQVGQLLPFITWCLSCMRMMARKAPSKAVLDDSS
jgi:hypothetical protein